MNRTGLAITFIVAVVIGVIFGVYARLDIHIAALFFNPNTKVFDDATVPWVQHARHASHWLIALLAAPAVVAIFGKMLIPRRRMLINARAALFLALTLAIGPGLVANVVLKNHSGRPRPVGITEFGGPSEFVPWWNLHGTCATNCSFIAGEPSGAFWALAPAALAPPQWRLLAYSAAVVFGAAVGWLRISVGAHFFTDVVFAGVFMYFVIWGVHGLIYRWRATPVTDEAIENSLSGAGTAMRDAFTSLVRRFGRRTGQSS